MILKTNIPELSVPLLTIILTAISAYAISYISIPSIVRVANTKKLFDEPGDRHVHTHSIPTLGGLAIYAGFIISISLFCNSHPPFFQYLVASTIVLFFIGVKDDILIIAPITKLSGQIVASLIVIVPGKLYLSDLHGFFGIHEIPFWVSIVLTIFVIIVITNGFNLIDGIDGLASAIGIITAGTYGIWFFMAKEYDFSLMAFGLVGATVAFFGFNVFGSLNKIFMGDTGSLIIGFVIALLTIKFNELNVFKNQLMYVPSTPSVSFGILIIPLFDVLRVMFIRFFLKKPMFQADKNHLHHQLLKLGLTHLMATVIISIFNILFIAFSFWVSYYVSIRRLLLLLLVLSMILSYIPVLLIYLKKKKLNN